MASRETSFGVNFWRKDSASAPFDDELSHVAHIEETRLGPHRQMLLDDAAELDGHLVAGEVRHTGAELAMETEKRRALQG